MKKLIAPLLLFSVLNVFSQGKPKVIIDSSFNVKSNKARFSIRSLTKDSITFFIYDRKTNETVLIKNCKLHPDNFFEYVYSNGSLALISISDMHKPNQRHASFYFKDGHFDHQKIKNLEVPSIDFLTEKSQQLYKQSRETIKE